MGCFTNEVLASSSSCSFQLANDVAR